MSVDISIIKTLENQMDAASRRIKECPGHSGGPQAEARYGAAYQALVRAGLRQQIKGKYR